MQGERRWYCSAVCRKRFYLRGPRNPRQFPHYFTVACPEEMYRALTMLAKERGLPLSRFQRIINNHYLQRELEIIGYRGWSEEL